MKLSLLVSGLVLALFPAVASAGAEEQITYEEAVANCEEFVNDPQLVTIEFKVSCFDESLEWRETDRLDLEQGNQGSRGHRILMKEKWFTPDFAIPVVIDPALSSCPVLSQFRTARQGEIVLSCEDFVENYSNPEDLATRCETVLADASVQTEATGKVYSPCDAAIR